MTLLSICQDVANEVGIALPTTITGSTGADETKLLRLANKTGSMIMREYEWQNLCAEFTGTAVAGQAQTGLLPSDYSRIVPDTFWDRSGVKLITGPISPVQWASMIATTRTLIERKYIYRGGVISIYPDMAGSEDLAFQYVSKNWCESSTGTAQPAFIADADVGIIDEELLTLGITYQFLENDGLPFGVALQQYDDCFDQLVKNESESDLTLTTGDIFGQGRGFSGEPATQHISSGWYS